MCQRDDADAVVEHAGERLHIDRTVVVVGNDVDPHAVAMRGLQHRQKVARIFDAVCEDPVAALELQCREGGRPAPSRAFDERNFVGRRVDEPSDVVVDGLDVVGAFRCRLVSSDRGFPFEMFDDRVGHNSWWQRGPRVVEMRNVRTARRVVPGPNNVDVAAGEGGAAHERSVRPAWTPVGSPLSMKTSPFTIVVRYPRARCT